MMALKEYTVLIHGIPHTMLLSDEDAKARGVYEADTTDKSDKPQKRSTK